MMYHREALVTKTVKELLVVGKQLEIIGRHDMKKQELIDSILALQIPDEKTEIVIKHDVPTLVDIIDEVKKSFKDIEEDLSVECKAVWGTPVEQGTDDVLKLPRAKDEYITNAKVGMIVAFNVNDTKVLSGMIKEIHHADFLIKTKNGIQFTVRKKNIIWVKTGARWPRGVYNALKGELPSECKGFN